MKLENQVVSLEYAKKLKELGVKQESYFVWSEYWHHQDGDHYFEVKSLNELEANEDMEVCSAFTVAELGNLISTVKGIRLDSTRHTTMDEWSIATSETERIYTNTEADCRAKMLIYLLENNLITNN